MAAPRSCGDRRGSEPTSPQWRIGAGFGVGVTGRRRGDASGRRGVPPRGPGGTEAVVEVTNKATRIRLFSVSTPQMRAFHMTWLAFFLCFFAWFGSSARRARPAIRRQWEWPAGGGRARTTRRRTGGRRSRGATRPSCPRPRPAPAGSMPSRSISMPARAASPAWRPVTPPATTVLLSRTPAGQEACLAGELLERYLFFAAVASPKMPGGV